MHAGLEVGIVLAGEEQVRIGETLISGRPGDVWLCSMSEPHRYRVVVPQTRNLVVVFLPSFLGDETLDDVPWISLFAADPRERPLTAPEMRERLLGIAGEIEREISRRGEGWQSIVRLDVLRLLFYLSRGWKDGSRSAVYGTNNVGRIAPALQLVHERIPGRVSREEAARACGLGPSRFTMLFRELMGASFTTFQRRTRIASAANVLTTSDLPVEEVAALAGFSDASHLHHAFVREHGCTPGQYRRQMQMPRARRTDRDKGQR